MVVKNALSIRHLSVRAGGKDILREISLTVRPSELHVLMGPNGSGKTTLAQVIAGNPAFIVSSGSVRIGRTDLLRRSPEERARLGIFVAFQHPLALPGVSIPDFLRVAVFERNAQRLRPSEVREKAREILERLGLAPTLLERELNVGFSGGEQKRFELAQLFFFGARIAVLDEIDSGVDLDGMRAIAASLDALRQDGTGILFITHNPHLVRYLSPDAVHVLLRGERLVSGGSKLGEEIAEKGFRSFVKSL